MRIIGYARVSSVEQAVNSHALDQQVARLRAAGAGEVLVDVQSAYRKKERPLLEKLLAMVAAGQVDEVVITRLDRLSRRGSRGFQALEIFQEAGVNLRALDQAFDLSTPAGRTQAGLLLVVGQGESDLKTEAVKAGTAYRRRQRKAFHPPFGYRMDGAGQLHLDTEPILCLLDGKEARSPAQIAREYITTYLERQSLAATTRTIIEKYGAKTIRRKGHSGIPLSVAGLSNWMKNPALRGHLQYLGGAEIVWDAHPTEVLITEAEFQRIQEILNLNKRIGGWGAMNDRHYLTGLMICDVCRRNLWINRGGGERRGQPRYQYGHCHQAQIGRCPNTGFTRLEVIETALIDVLVAAAERIAAMVTDKTSTTREASPEVQRLRGELAKVEALMASSSTTTFLAQHATHLRNQIAALTEGPPPTALALRAELAEIGADRGFWEKTLTPSEKAILYPHFVEAIRVRDRAVVGVDLKV